jgi:hypothetical protein
LEDFTEGSSPAALFFVPKSFARGSERRIISLRQREIGKAKTNAMAFPEALGLLSLNTRARRPFELLASNPTLAIDSAGNL